MNSHETFPGTDLQPPHRGSDPDRETAAPLRTSDGSRSGDVNRRSVLFVDDEEDLADMYARWLDDSYDVRSAYSGEEALETIDEVDLVFLDRRMPGLSGDEVLDRIIERDIDCRVVMLSAIEPDFEGTIGYDKYLTKPVTEETLFETIDELLG